ncbi:MAG: hypothetical protein CMP61_11095 [Flavobacteriales bacterium]|nr:hypothetical protein [Flavobacteriales bacterium]|tara:strand:- start:4535 stop:5164 length:630 start_codon:yes stop_codon:yes gene_type:complete
MEKWHKNILMKGIVIIIMGSVFMKFFPPINETVPKKPDYSSKTTAAFKFVKRNHLDTTICFLIDMRVHAGKRRFAIWDFMGDSVMREMIVTHGSAGVKGLPESRADLPTFSNLPGSFATSLGKYRVGRRSYSNWGINVHYKLHGLDSTNSNAYRRIVVLHSFSGVDKAEIYPEEPPYSLGCPMVSNEDMTYLDGLLKRKKNVLMWIYFD